MSERLNDLVRLYSILDRLEEKIGGVDSYLGRHELEVACRRYLAHYIDIGMDVHGEKQSYIGGQVILSQRLSEPRPAVYMGERRISFSKNAVSRQSQNEISSTIRFATLRY